MFGWDIKDIVALHLSFVPLVVIVFLTRPGATWFSRIMGLSEGKTRILYRITLIGALLAAAFAGLSIALYVYNI